MKRKYRIVYGAIAIVLLIVSSATAVPEVNGKLVSDSLENSVTEQNDDFINQMMALYDQLEIDGVSPDVDQDLENIDLTQFFDESLYVDVEGFVNYIISDDFIQVINENYTDIVSNNGFQVLWNTEYVQEYVQSDVFINFMNTDEAQYILDNLDIPSNDQQEFETQVVNMNTQVSTTEPEQENLLNKISQIILPSTKTQVYSTQSDVTLEATAVSTSEETIQTSDILVLWVVILIGILTWIPGVIITLLSSPVYFLYMWILGMIIVYMYWGVWIFPFVEALAALVETIFYVMVNTVCWPVAWPFFLDWWLHPI